MKKDAYYFPHFCNARNDSKIVKIRRVLGLEGYAIYFMLLEVLREQTEFKYPISGVEDLAYEWHTSKEKILNVIYDYELFQIDSETNFFSTKLVLYLQPYLEKSARASLAANERWKKVKLELESNTNNANAMQMHSEINANDIQVKQIKENKSKIISKPPREFYSEQYTQNKNADTKTLKEYGTFVAYILGKNDIQRPLTIPLSYKEQITFEQFSKLTTKGMTIEKMTSYLDSIENKAYKNNSLFLTFSKWFSKEDPLSTESKTSKKADKPW